MQISDQEMNSICDLIRNAIAELKVIMKTMTIEEAKEFFIMAMIFMGIVTNDNIQLIVKSDKELIELFSSQLVH